MKKRKWLIVAIVAALLVLAFLASRGVDAADTGACGPGLAAQDLAGTCRAANPTPGALEAIGSAAPPAPVPPKPEGVRIVPPKPAGVTVEPR